MANKTQPTDASVTDYLDSVDHPTRRADARVLRQMMEEITGQPATMWGDSLVGFDEYHYRYDSGREGDFFMVGFAPRSSRMVVYVMPGLDGYADTLARLGKHKTGRSCLYINKLADVDMEVLRELVEQAYEAMKGEVPGVTPAFVLAPLGLACAGGVSVDSAAPRPLVAVTWNTGTSEGMAHDAPPDDGYSSDHALTSDAWYGDGLAWTPAVEAARRWLERASPDLIGFQEIFWSGACAEIPEESWPDFVCEGWSEGEPTVAQRVLGEDYQVACHVGHPDKCAAIRRDFGVFEGCDEDLCLEGLEGWSVEGCGSGARVGRARVIPAEGEPFTLVNVHGSSGFSSEDEACRVAQVDQVFVDLGDGAPAADGPRNLVLGDLNTDPGRLAEADPSAARWLEHAGQGSGWTFHTAMGPDAEPTYAGVTNIDHVLSDAWQGGCVAAGLEGEPEVLEAVYFDHRPITCALEPR